MAPQLPPNVRCLPPSLGPQMDVDPLPLVPQPVYFASRTNLETPRPRQATRNSGYPLRSSPLAGPVIAVTRPSIIDDTYVPEDVYADRTRKGATPSRISTLHLTPPSSLRNVSMSRTPSPSRTPSLSRSPSPSRSMSDVSVRSSASSATSLSMAHVPLLSPTIPSSSRPHPRPRSLVQPHSQPLLHARTRTSIPVTAPFEYPSSTAPFVPNTSRDPTRNWLTTTTPPTFSRSRVNGVVMPVKASGRRPQTAPAASRTYHGTSGHDSGVVSASPQRRHSRRMEPLSPVEARRAMSWDHHPHELCRPDLCHGVGTAIIRKQRRPRSLMALSLRSALGEVCEEHEREGDGEGDVESGKDRIAASGDTAFVDKELVFPVLSMKNQREDGSPAAQGGTKNAAGWLKRGWKTSLNVVKGTFVKTGNESTVVAP
ncbi:hypothetical protein JB92DRAFT_3111880 [Gautieria morchelliformis]|nr:hypothetical protein JB92DRAFT_3111880 [Gautieria morchelliformis]